MKRRISSTQFRELKRANSSLFSIATIVDDQDGDDSVTGTVDRRTSSIGSNIDLVPLAENVTKTGKNKGAEHARKVSMGGSGSSPIPPTTPTTTGTEEESDVSSSDGFFIEDDDDDDGNLEVMCTPTSQHVPPSTVRISHEDDEKSTTPPTPKASEDALAAAETAESEKAEVKDHRTGVVFESGDKHFDRHNRFHKERPLRITSIRDYLRGSSHSFSERCSLFGETEDGKAGVSPEDEWLDDDDYLRVHFPGYMQRLDRLSNCNCCDRLDREAEQYKSIYFTPESVREAKAAAASLCRLTSRVVTGKLDNGFAVIRPPGHHAEPGLAGGYCVINNVAVAAAYAREKLGVGKVLIVDWDVHHGNGTQSIFLNDPDVMYFSVHRYHGGNFFPFLQNGGPTSAGTGEGTGFNINVGWNKKGMGDEEYLAVWDTLLMPLANEFQPDLVIVSAGFDAADGDLGECRVTPDCFARLTRSLKTLANGKVVCALEGGYVRSVLGKCVESVVETLLDRESTKKLSLEEGASDDVLDAIDSSAAKSIRSTIAVHQEYWSCLKMDK